MGDDGLLFLEIVAFNLHLSSRRHEKEPRRTRIPFLKNSSCPSCIRHAFVKKDARRTLYRAPYNCCFPMRAMVLCAGARELQMLEREPPVVLPGDVLVKVRACG